MSSPKRALLAVVLLPTLILADRYIFRHSVGEVQSALQNAELIGLSPEQAVEALRRIRLRRGDTLTSVSYAKASRVVEAQCPRPRVFPAVGWSLNITLSVDSTDRVYRAVAGLSAHSPF